MLRAIKIRLYPNKEQAKQYEYIDLGLPSGLKWAKCNVGAEKETDYGYYFQWGETTPYTDYTWAAVLL